MSNNMDLLKFELNFQLNMKTVKSFFVEAKQ